MTLLDHLAELRTRLFIALGAWVVGAGIAFAYRIPILKWLQQPLPENINLLAIGVFEPFFASMQIAGFFGLVLAIPIIAIQVWGFVAPGLYPEERRYAVPFVLLTALAFSFGVLFGRYVVLPLSIPIIVGFLGGAIEVLPSIGDYISRILLIMAVFGLIFEMPVLGFLFARIGLLRADVMLRYRRYSVVIGLVLAAVITPTADPFNFALVAIPLVVLYEVSIHVVRLSQRKADYERDDSNLTQAN